MRSWIPFFLLMIISCDFVDDYYYRVDPQLKPYVDRFYNEAEKRGVVLTRTGLTVILEENIPCHSESCAGTSNSTLQYIAIDKEFFQREKNERTKTYGEKAIEFTLFHEMGHAVMFKEHKNGFRLMDCCGTPLRSYCKDVEARDRILNDFFKD